MGDGAFIAWFDDGTVTSSDWKVFTTSFGPTAASETAGCSANNLGPCAIETTAEPAGWTAATFDHSAWKSATVYTEAKAGWGRTPTYWWFFGDICMQSTSPLTGNNLAYFSGNVDASGKETEVKVSYSDCLDPQAVLKDKPAAFIWGADLEKDNTILLRYNAGNQHTKGAKTLAAASSVVLGSIVMMGLY